MNISGNSTITLQQGKKYKDATIKKYSSEGFETFHAVPIDFEVQGV